MSTPFASLHVLVPTYRRDSSEVIGAVRRSSVEFLGMEQMPGGKFQITARTMSGADAFVSPVKTSLAAGQASLESARRSFGGEDTDPSHVRSGDPTDGLSTRYDTVPPGRENNVDEEASVDGPPVGLEPRIPMFTFADIEVPELPTSVH